MHRPQRAVRDRPVTGPFGAGPCRILPVLGRRFLLCDGHRSSTPQLRLFAPTWPYPRAVTLSDPPTTIVWWGMEDATEPSPIVRKRVWVLHGGVISAHHTILPQSAPHFCASSSGWCSFGKSVSLNQLNFRPLGKHCVSPVHHSHAGNNNVAENHFKTNSTQLHCVAKCCCE